MSAQPNDGKPPKIDLTVNTSEEDLFLAETLVQLSKSKVHQCKRCMKIFLSGQALGGHQRKHYKGPLKKNKTKVIVDDTNIDLKPKVDVVTTNNDFDLNMPPPPDNFEIGEASNSKEEEEVEEGEITDI